MKEENEHHEYGSWSWWRKASRGNQPITHLKQRVGKMWWCVPPLFQVPHMILREKAHTVLKTCIHGNRQLYTCQMEIPLFSLRLALKKVCIRLQPPYICGYVRMHTGTHSRSVGLWYSSQTQVPLHNSWSGLQCKYVL